MNLSNNPDLLDRLAASYALGTLRGGARRRFEALARRSATVRAAALIWQERFASMTELQATDQPSVNVWKRIENLLDAQPGAAPAESPAGRAYGDGGGPLDGPPAREVGASPGDRPGGRGLVLLVAGSPQISRCL